MLSFKKILTWFLIGLLLFQEIFHIPLILPRASALEVSSHEDVVALVVEQELYGKMREDVEKYALRIQARLPQTRTVILTFPRDAHPYVIASSLERLYFSGIPDHGKKTQKLVGTVLIGHVPLPVVHRDGSQFLSMFPYTDFDEPHFAWNWQNERYDYISTSRKDPQPDVWHSVIDPNSGTLDSDVTQIRDFFAKVYEYDAKQGRYADVGKDPQVLYMDSINESKSASQGLLASYEQLFLPHQEDYIYHRYTKEFAQYLYESFLALMQSEGAAAIVPFSQWKKPAESSASFLDNASDIASRVFSKELIMPFVKVVNEKYLGDVARWVHNTGRYYNGYSEVRLDSMPEIITKKDSLSTQVLKETNDALEQLIDRYVDTSMAMDIPLLISRPGQKTITETARVDDEVKRETNTYNFLYENYFSGTKASEITDARSCSLLRGSSFGPFSTQTEINHAYNPDGVRLDTQLIEQDTNAKIQCNPLTQSYWGGNSALNATFANGQMVLGNHRDDDFPVSILDQGAGKRTTGTNSPLDCLQNDLILKPYQHTGIVNRKYLWPTETGGTRYSCVTKFLTPTPAPFALDPSPEPDDNILINLESCSGTAGKVSLLARDGSKQATCIAGSSSGTYKRISSLVKHADPTREIYGAQIKSMATPNLPVDGERYLLYLDRTGHEARLNYPNIFDIAVTPTDTDESIEKKIVDLLMSVNSQFVIQPLQKDSWNVLLQTSTEQPDLAKILLENADLKAGLIDALKWKSLDIEAKYSHALDISLSKSTSLSGLIMPEKKDLYEIAYLGGQGDARNFVFGFSPDDKKALPKWFQDIQDIQNSYENAPETSIDDNSESLSLTAGQIAALLGEEGEDSEVDDSETPADGGFSCGDPSGVVIWEWPQAIQCWLSDLLKTEWFTPPEIGDLEFPFPELASIDVSLGGVNLFTKTLKSVGNFDVNNDHINDYIEQNASFLKLNNTYSDTTINPQSSFRIDAILEDASFRIDDDLSTVRVVVTRIDDLDNKTIHSPADADWEKYRDSYVSVSGPSQLKDGHAVWIVRSLGNTRMRVHIETQVYGNNKAYLTSEKNTILIGNTDIPLTVISSAGTEGFQTITAGDSQGLHIRIGGQLDIASTADIGFYDYITGAEIARYSQVPVSAREIKIGSPAVDSVIRRAGKYSLKVSTGDMIGETRFTIAPAAPARIAFDTASVFLLDQPQSIGIRILDQWDNQIPQNNWKISVGASENVIFGSNSEMVRTYSGQFNSTLHITPKKSGNLQLDVTLTKDEIVQKASISRQVLPEIRLVSDIASAGPYEVGKDIPVIFSLQRADGSVIETWNGPLSIGVTGGRASLEKKTLDFVAGKASTVFHTGSLPATTYFTLSEVGLGKIVGSPVQIIPGPPQRLTLTHSDTLHAKLGSKSTVRFQVTDIYGNLTDLSNYSLHFEVDNPTLVDPIVAPKNVSTGILETELVNRGLPGRLLLHAWLKVGEVKSTITTLENASRVNFLPVLDAAQARKNSWQTLTQVLLGGPFGQSPTQGYLAGSLLFSPDAKTLSVSTTLDSIRSPAVTVKPHGGLELGYVQYGTGLAASVEGFVDGRLNVLVTDSRLGNVARVDYPQISPEALLVPCDKPAGCDQDIVTFVPTGENISYKNGVVSRANVSLFSVRDIFAQPNLRFTFVPTASDVLQFEVRNGNEVLGVIQISWSARLPLLDNASLNTYVLHSLRENLLSRTSWTEVSSYQIPSVSLYDPDASEQILVDGSHEQGWSQYPEKMGLGWTSDNRSLLQFTSGQEWSIAQRDHSDYLTVNIGDPLIRLPEYNVNAVTGLDHTLGTPVYQATTAVTDMTFRDINNDDRDDLIAFHNDGTVGARVIRDASEPLDIGDLLSVQDAEEGMVRAGDFIGDGFSDIVYVDTTGNLRLIAYDAQGPAEKIIKYNETPLLGEVKQLEVFDMDHDAVDDIIIMDSLGTLYIFYGTSSGVFTVQVVDSAYDFVFSKKPESTYFIGAVRYSGPGFRDPDTIATSKNLESVVKQQRINNALFTKVKIGKDVPDSNIPQTKTTSLGNEVYQSFNNDFNGYMRGYNGDAAAVGAGIKTGFDSFQQQGGAAITVTRTPVGSQVSYDTFDLLNAPFVDQSKLLITKQYSSLEESGKIVPGSPIQVTMTLKNNSAQTLSDFIILEKFPEYLDVSDNHYTAGSGDTQKTGEFISDTDHPGAGIIDLRGLQIAPGQSYTITYKGEMRSFTFGRFDVGYLEDSLDPTSSSLIPKEKIRTIQPKAMERETMIESEFYDHDNYGDIRFNPNETCGGPVLLWRSHNTFERTYHKTVIVRDIPDPEKAAVEASKDPTSLVPKEESDMPTDAAAMAERVSEAQSSLDEMNADSDGDYIPDAADDDGGDVFEISSSGNTTQINVGLGKLDAVIDQITGYVQDIIKGLSCGFGSAGCISMPINWAANIPGNTVTAMGYAVPGSNQPPYACHEDVRCGYPVFAYPTICSSDGSTTCMWPYDSQGAGGAFDYVGGSSSTTGGNGLNDSPNSSGAVSGKTAKKFTGGEGVSQYRLFMGGTLTGAVAAVYCFGPNTQANSSMANPGQFPVPRFDGNCVFATAPIMQCKDDGSGETPLLIEMDIDSELGEEGDDGDGGNGGNSFSNADECGFYEPIESYPADVSGAVSAYFARADDTSVSNLQTVLDEHTELAGGTSDSSLSMMTLAPDDSFERLNGINGLGYTKENGGVGMIQLSLDPSELKFKKFGEVVDINLTSIKAFPNFIMDWVQRQIDEIVSSLANLPDIKIVLPELSGLNDAGWISSFKNAGSSLKSAFQSTTTSPNSQTQTAPPAQTQSTANTSSSTNGTTPTSTGNTTTTNSATTTSASTTTSTPSSSTSGTSNSGNTGNSLTQGYTAAFDTVGNGLKSFGNTIDAGLSSTDKWRDSAVGTIKQKTTGIENAFEYIGNLPIIDVHPETISFNIPWVGKQEAQAWINRNEAVLEGWKNLPSDAANSVNYGSMVASIESNIETVKSYLELPEKLQNLFYLKEKLLYGILQNVQAVQDLMGGWLYENGLRFKAWVETFILVTKLWDLWQIIVDIFDDYEATCGVCINERWNLKHWLWIIISIIIPPLPVIAMPRWPDVELDFSDIDLSLDIAYPVFNLSFYPVYLPDAPLPTVSGFAIQGMPQLPSLPNLDIDFEIPVIQLPDLPDLPPPPKIPELSQALEIVLEIFRLIVLYECLYKKVPLSPEWVVGTKVAHKTERQGYLPFDFLDIEYPKIQFEWIDTIRVATHVDLKYDVDFITDMIREALEPFTQFPKNFDRLDIPSSVNFNIDPSNPSVDVSTRDYLPDLVTRLLAVTQNPTYIESQDARASLSQLLLNTNIPADQRERIEQVVFSDSVISADITPAQKALDERFALLQNSLQKDIDQNGSIIADLGAWSRGEKRPEEIAFLSGSIPGTVHLASSPSHNDSSFLSLDRNVLAPALQLVAQTTTESPSSVNTVAAPLPDVPDPKTQNSFPAAEPIDTTSLRRTRGLYVVNGNITQRLIDYTEDLDGKSKIYAHDDDGDGDEDVFYSFKNIIYRKENHEKNPVKYFITDTPKVYTQRDIYSDFFGLDDMDMYQIHHDGQIDLLQSDSSEYINFQYLARTPNDHLKLDLYRGPLRDDQGDAAYRIDIVPDTTPQSFETSRVIPQPYLSDIDGQAIIHHKKLYRTLLPGREFLDENGATQPLSDDFVIRANQSGYAREKTNVTLFHGGVEEKISLSTGDRLLFAEDSQIDVTRGSLLLFANTPEDRLMTQSDIGLPLLDTDRITTGQSGAVDISFADDTGTQVTASQEWMLHAYKPVQGIQTGRIKVQPDWYYGVTMDAHTLSEKRLNRSTLFDATIVPDTSDPIPQIPREISLLFDRPTTIDFQSYFPADTIDHVDVLQLESSQWRRDTDSSTKLIFLTQQQKKNILVRITANGRTRDYKTSLVTKTPKMVVDSVDSSGVVRGALSQELLAPMGIQTLLGTTIWPLASGISVQGRQFSADLPDPKYVIGQNSRESFSIDRSTGKITLANNVTIVPKILLGKPLSVDIVDGSYTGNLAFHANAFSFAQVPAIADMTSRSIYLVGTDVRLETAALNDAALAGGAYITDTAYQPLLAIDKTGIVRYMDTTVSWSATVQDGVLSINIIRAGKELGKIVIHGDMITSWQGK